MSKLKKIRYEDTIAIFVFVFAYIYSFYYRRKRSDIWLISESGFEARDNAYWLFKYIRENTDDIDAVFVITKESSDFDKVNRLGEVVEYKSFRHWVYYLSAKVNISTHKAGNPNAAVCYVLEVLFNLSKNRIFLQHGITLSDAKWLYYDKTKFSMFICAARLEYEYIKNLFGYPEAAVQLLGFTRFDSLVSKSHAFKRILIMPSWRNWLVNHTDNQSVSDKEEEVFVQSNFYTGWMRLLSDETFVEYCGNSNIEIAFFPHRNMQPFLHLFKGLNGINLYSWEDYDIQEVLRESDLLITDYSSVSLDFSYMDKPVIYYQFDEEEFREKQYAEGYFNYKNGGFGDWITESTQVISIVQRLNENSFVIEDVYKNRIDDFFGERDSNNNLRTVNAIKDFILNKELK